MTKTMPFPREYKKHLQRGRKDTTIRIQKEVGKYRRGKTYEATDYKGNPFNIEIKVLNVIYTPFKKVRKHIPDAELNRPEFKRMKEDDKVNIIKFKATPNKIQQWIDDNVKDPHGNCFFYAATLAALFPELKLIRGTHSKQFKEDTNHFWVQDKDKIYDPTVAQYEKGKYYDAKPINVDINLDYVMKDPMFKTLQKKDQDIIIKRWKNKDEIVY